MLATPLLRLLHPSRIFSTRRSHVGKAPCPIPRAPMGWVIHTYLIQAIVRASAARSLCIAEVLHHASLIRQKKEFIFLRHVSKERTKPCPMGSFLPSNAGRAPLSRYDIIADFSDEDPLRACCCIAVDKVSDQAGKEAVEKGRIKRDQMQERPALVTTGRRISVCSDPMGALVSPEQSKLDRALAASLHVLKIGGLFEQGRHLIFDGKDFATQLSFRRVYPINDMGSYRERPVLS